MLYRFSAPPPMSLNCQQKKQREAAHGKEKAFKTTGGQRATGIRPGKSYARDAAKQGRACRGGKHDLEPSEEFMKNNPFKTAPNNLTSKGMSDKEKG